MTPQLQTSIQMLQMTTLELEQMIEQEMLENPFLELSETENSSTEETGDVDDSDVRQSASDELETKEPSDEDPDRLALSLEPENRDSEEGFLYSAPSDNNENHSADTEDQIPELAEHSLDANIGNFDDLDINWNELYDDSEPISVTSRKEDSEEYDFTDFVAIKESIFENLKRQLRLSALSGKDFEIGEYIIGNLDENGYLAVSVSEIAAEQDVPLDKVEKILKIIQTFDPTGIAARDLKECLKIQLEELGIKDPVYFEILEKHLDLLQKKKFKELAKTLDVPINKIAQVFSKISSLEPKPGRALSKEQAMYIKPDVIVKKINNKYVYMLSDGDMNNLKINSFYRKILKNGNSFSKDEKKYAVDKFRSAIWLIKNIEKRKNTILRVTEVIMERQKDFLEKGIEYLKPLTLREVAEIIKMHESTVARVTTNKYVDTPQGIFELKFFFSSGIENESGVSESSTSIKEKIQKLIEAENPKSPLSDQKIVELLSKDGLTIARRTVAKYRDQLKILPKKLRKSAN